MIQVYTGNGKGKTTAALGLALRAAGAGLNVYIAQFAKGRLCSEHKALKKIRNIKLEQFGNNCFIGRKPAKKDLILAKRGLEKVRSIIESRNYDLIVLDEINLALKLRLIKLKEIVDLLKRTSRKIELVLTGRDAPVVILKMADLISEIKEIKHYYKKGQKARRGIEF